MQAWDWTFHKKVWNPFTPSSPTTHLHKVCFSNFWMKFGNFLNNILTWKKNKIWKVSCQHSEPECSWQMSRLMTKPTKWSLHPAKTQISLAIRPGWSESSLSAWRNIGFSVTHWAHTAKTLIRLGGCPGWSKSSLGTCIIFDGFVIRRLKYLAAEDHRTLKSLTLLLLSYEPHHEKTVFKFSTS